MIAFILRVLSKAGGKIALALGMYSLLLLAVVALIVAVIFIAVWFACWLMELTDG